MGKKRPLWAPWRIEFLRAKKDEKCFLCDNEPGCPENRAEALIVFRGKLNFIIMNRFPYNSGHLMISPYRHTGNLSELTVEERNEMMALCVTAKEVLEKTIHPEGFNVGLNLGAAAGAGVAEHLHLHIVPRWKGDANFMPVIGDIRVVPEALEQTATLLRRNWPPNR